MARKPLTLIHTALPAEARPLIRYFGLKQSETRPWKIFTQGPLVLVVSGAGEENTRSALAYITGKYRIGRAFNAGIAGVTDPDIPVGSLYRAELAGRERASDKVSAAESQRAIQKESAPGNKRAEGDMREAGSERAPQNQCGAGSPRAAGRERAVRNQSGAGSPHAVRRERASDKVSAAESQRAIQKESVPSSERAARNRRGAGSPRAAGRERPPRNQRVPEIPSSIPALPVRTAAVPLTGRAGPEVFLADMEAAHFKAALQDVVRAEDLYIFKVVSDHLESTTPKREFVERLIENSLPLWASLADPYPEKLRTLLELPAARNLPEKDRQALRDSALSCRFTHQELKNLIDAAADFVCWQVPGIAGRLGRTGRPRREVYNRVLGDWNRLKNTPREYTALPAKNQKSASSAGPSGILAARRIPRSAAAAAPEQEGAALPPENEPLASGPAAGPAAIPEAVPAVKPVCPSVQTGRETPGFGRCPVASPRTRCCNLLTLDAVEGCGFECSYCSIRYFYKPGEIGIDRNFPEKLARLSIDPEKIYHIGTGQSSDSLMWGNRAGILGSVLDFAAAHPNVILELKTKSDNIAYLLDREIPPNVITTWSVNPQPIIDEEERLTASLERRLNAARQISDKGNLVGFHLHPMVYYSGWQKGYGDLISRITDNFRPEKTAMVSIGTLTFIKPLIRKIREEKHSTRILQMPLEDAGGKYSYPLDIKKELFSFAYQSFSAWHGKVFFYMCMEDISLWPQVFGYDYADNGEFEADMKKWYLNKIRRSGAGSGGSGSGAGSGEVQVGAMAGAGGAVSAGSGGEAEFGAADNPSNAAVSDKAGAGGAAGITVSAPGLEAPGRRSSGSGARAVQGAPSAERPSGSAGSTYGAAGSCTASSAEPEFRAGRGSAGVLTGQSARAVQGAPSAERPSGSAGSTYGAAGSGTVPSAEPEFRAGRGSAGVLTAQSARAVQGGSSAERPSGSAGSTYGAAGSCTASSAEPEFRAGRGSAGGLTGRAPARSKGALLRSGPQGVPAALTERLK